MTNKKKMKVRFGVDENSYYEVQVPEPTREALLEWYVKEGFEQHCLHVEYLDKETLLVELSVTCSSEILCERKINPTRPLAMGELMQSMFYEYLSKCKIVKLTQIKTD